MTITTIAWCMTGFLIIGSILNSYQKKSCFYLWIPANIFFIWFNYYKGIYVQCFLFTIFTIIATIGLYAWNKEDKKKKKEKEKNEKSYNNFLKSHYEDQKKPYEL